MQISRLGNPLINEAVIPRGKKDFWNASDPSDDIPVPSLLPLAEVTKLENALYDALDNANESNRDDLVAILLTGVPGLNFTGQTKADLLRLNTGIAPTADVGDGDRLGVLAGDLAGYPNGRRLEDDVVDIDLRAFAEGYGAFLNGLLGLPNRSPNNLLGDGVERKRPDVPRRFPLCRDAVLRLRGGSPDPHGRSVGRQAEGACTWSRRPLPHWRGRDEEKGFGGARGGRRRCGGRSLRRRARRKPRRGHGDPCRPGGGGPARWRLRTARRHRGVRRGARAPGGRAPGGRAGPHAPRPRLPAACPGDGRPRLLPTLGGGARAFARSVAGKRSGSDGARRSRRLKASLRGRPLAGGEGR